MSSIRLIIATIALLAVPVASAAPAPEAVSEPVEVHACLYGGVTVVVLDRTVVECFPSPSKPVVEQCGTVAYQVEAGPVATSCIVVFEHYYCPGGGGYVVVLGVQVGQCTVCCDPAPMAAGPPVEFTQCDHWGTGVAVYGKEVVCLTTGCSPMCTTAAEADAPYRVYYCYNGAGVEVYGVVDTGCIPVGGCSIHCATATDADAPEVTLRTCNYHPPGRQVYYGEKPVGPCILLPPPSVATGAPEPFPLLRVESCPEGQGSRIYATGEDIQVTECSGAPVTVDLRCNAPAYGVQVFVGGKAVTTCIPLPHGV